VTGTLPFPAPAAPRARPVLVTGGAGFIGSNLVDRLAADGHDVLIYDALARPGVEANVGWLKSRHGKKVSATVADVRDAPGLAEAAKDASAVVHLAAQVAVTTSLDEPLRDFEVNAASTLTLLEALRKRGGGVPLLFASTNKVYGGLGDVPLELAGEAYRPVDRALHTSGISEARPLDFHTPYGCSKGAADQYVLDYARSFGVPTCVFRMSCIYGPRQRGTEDQGWVAHFLIKALRDEAITIFGDGRQVRDLLHVADAVEAYVRALARIGEVSGRAFNLGGGPANAASLLEVVDAIEALLGRRPELAFDDWRPGDQRWYVSDARAAHAALGLGGPTGWRDGLADLAAWLQGQDGVVPAREALPIAVGASA
jgi:CDP-paratose 2-epimerase